MPEADSLDRKQFHADVPARNPAFFLKGSGAYDWGMQSRLDRVFSPRSGRTVMLAIDHGYFQGPTTGLERVDLNIVPLLSEVDALFCTRGILRSTVPVASGVPVFLRGSGGPSILKELSDEELAIDIEDALRLNACGVGVQVFIGGPMETQTVHNMTRLIDAGLPLRDARAGRDRGRPRADPRFALPGPRDPHPRRARRAGRQDLLLRRGLRGGHRGLPGAHRHGRRQEAARARSAAHGLPGRGPGRLGRGHGPQHLPVRFAPGHAARGARRGPRRPQPGAGAGAVPDGPRGAPADPRGRGGSHDHHRASWRDSRRAARD